MLLLAGNLLILQSIGVPPADIPPPDVTRKPNVASYEELLDKTGK